MRKVLLVEDDNFQIIVVRHIFDKHFPAVDLRIANNGSEALAHLKETHFDLITKSTNGLILSSHKPKLPN